MPFFSLPGRGRQGACPCFFRRCVAVGGRGRVRRPPHPLRPAECLVGERCVAVGGRGRVRRPPHPLRPARCRCRVRIGVGLGCGRPVRGERAAKTRSNLPAFLRKDCFAFLLHFAACRAETLLRGDDRPIGCLRDGWYGERRALTSRFLSPEPLSCTAGRWNELRGGDWPIGCLMDGWYGERGGRINRLLCPLSPAKHRIRE